MSNSTSPIFLADDLYQETKSHFERLKSSFDASWKTTQNAVEFFARIIHRQSLRIRSLEARATELENGFNERNALVDTLESKLVEITKSFESQLAQKQNQLGETERRNAEIIESAKRTEAYAAYLREIAKANDERYRRVVAQVANLQQSRNAQQTETPRDLGECCSDDKLSTIASALRRELDARSDAVRQAATTVAKEAAEVNAALNKAYNESQARVASLEEQLRVTKDSMTPHVDKSPPAPVPDPKSFESPIVTSDRIISGTYRPKPSLPIPSNIQPPSPVENGSITGSGSVVAPSSSTPPDVPPGAPPRSSPAPSIGQPVTAPRDIIDLTSGDDPSNNNDPDPDPVSDSAPPRKRLRVDPST